MEADAGGRAVLSGDPTERTYSEASEAEQVRDLLARAGLGQRAAGRELGINERTMRGYCAGDKVPRVVMLALERLVDLRRQLGDHSA